MEPVIRKAKKSDFEKVKHFLRDHYELTYPEIPYDKIKKYAESSFKENVGKEGTFVLELGNQIIGYLSVSIEKDDRINARKGYIHMTHIAKKFRGKGYSHFLMKTADEFFKKKKVKFCTLDTDLKNKTAIGLYKKYGYKPWRLEMKRLQK
jgi:ribosomal protein S18 acetylase RimI-like enzyme